MHVNKMLPYHKTKATLHTSNTAITSARAISTEAFAFRYMTPAS